jgi:hypothetical protein
VFQEIDYAGRCAPVLVARAKMEESLMAAAETKETIQYDTHQKALSINLDTTTYGTLAEIGAGQEVARWFLQVGAASGTVAKTISAYDMTISDAIYGSTDRYVSRQRLLRMLDHEYELLESRLGDRRSVDCRFFVFADTVSARNYAGTNECQGWLGLRFQAQHGAPPNDIIVHVNLLDNSNLLQQQAVGILGVNLIHAAFHHRSDLTGFLERLFDELSTDRIEIDVLELTGPEFVAMDQRDTIVQLIRSGCAAAVLFGADGRVIPPSELIRKRPLVFAAGVFAEPESVHVETLEAARTELLRELAGGQYREPLALFAMTTRRPKEQETATTAELLARIDRVCRTGSAVLLSREPEVHHLVSYAKRYTDAPIRLVLDVLAIAQVLSQASESGGGAQLLEVLAKLFAYNVRVYIHPTPAAVFRGRAAGAGINRWVSAAPDVAFITAGALRPPLPIAHLYAYLNETGFLAPLDLPKAGTPPFEHNRSG